MDLAALVVALGACVLSLFAIAIALDARDFWRELLDDFRTFQRRRGFEALSRAPAKQERRHVN